MALGLTSIHKKIMFVKLKKRERIQLALGIWQSAEPCSEIELSALFVMNKVQNISLGAIINTQCDKCSVVRGQFQFP